MRYPVNYIAITNKFKKGEHYGLDLGYQQNVYSIADGKVIYKKVQTTGGKVLHIRHSNGYVSEYAHLDSWCVNKGDKVKMGQKIGIMGKSGIVTGIHLHLGIYKGSKINYNKRGKFVDPVSVLNKTTDQTVNSKTAKKYKIKEFPIKQVNSKNGLNVRNKPSVLGKKVDFLNYKEEVEVIKTKGSWSKISYNEDKWVTSKYLK